MRVVGNLFMVFGEPDIDVRVQDSHVVVEIRGLDVYDPTTGEIRSHTTDDIACWFIDTDYNAERLFVRQAISLVPATRIRRSSERSRLISMKRPGGVSIRRPVDHFPFPRQEGSQLK